MGLIARQPSAPIADGDAGSAPEIEGELNSLFNVLNGNLDNSNFASDADLAGTQFASASIPGTKIQNLGLAVAKFTASTVTTAQMARVAVPKAYASTYTAPATAAVATATTYSDVPGIGTISVGDVTVGDQVRMEFRGQVKANVDVFPLELYFAFSVDGTDTADLVKWDCTLEDQPFSVVWQAAAPASTFSVVPRVRRVNAPGTDTTVIYWQTSPMVFRVLSIPAK